jgi:hypothetical protein
MTPLIKAMADFGTKAADFVRTAGKEIADKVENKTDLGRFYSVMGAILPTLGGDNAKGMDNLSRARARGDVSSLTQLAGAGLVDTLYSVDAHHDNMYGIIAPGAQLGDTSVYSAMAAGTPMGDAFRKYADGLLQSAADGLKDAFSGSVKEKTSTNHEPVITEPDVITKLQRYVASKIDDAVRDAVAAAAGVSMNMGDEAQFKRWTFAKPGEGGSALDRLNAADKALPRSFAAPDNSADYDIDEANRKAEGQRQYDLAFGNAEKKRANAQTFLESAFGKKEEFSLYQTLFKSLTGSITSAYKAWVDGSISAAQAAKMVLKESLASLGEESAVKSLYELAAGFASLALGPIGGVSASQHFTASAIYGAVAIASGAASRAIGKPGGGGSAGGPSAPNVSGSGSNDNGSQKPSGGVIVVGDSFADDSYFMRSLKAKRLVKLATGNGGGVTNS